jgi:hypothetical protein
MNSPAVAPFAPSTRPALELIALAQLSPEQARQKLRALLLANPNYFGKVPSTSFIAVLKIQEDTTYECISRVGYDPQCEQLCAVVEIKQDFGYSSDALIHGSVEFVRFYLSYDGGSMWLDQGMRSVNAIDGHLPRAAHEVKLQIIPAEELSSPKFLPKVRAILSWNSPPPAGAPNWTPVWGNVVESDIRIEDSQVDFPGTMESVAKSEFPKTSSYVMGTETEMNSGTFIRQVHLQSTMRHSAKTDPQRRFLAFVLARVARFQSSASLDSHSNGMDPVDRDGMATGFPPASAAEPTASAVL